MNKIKEDIYRLTLYSFKGPFQLLHTDIGFIKYLAKSAVDPKYFLFFVDLFTSKIYAYTMKIRRLFKKKIQFFL